MEDKKCTECNSINIHFVKYEMKNGIKILRKQCKDCGRLLTRGYKRNLVIDFDSLPDMNIENRHSYKLKKIELSSIKIILFNYRQEYFNRRYNYYHNIYLKSKEWKHKRDLIMKYYNFECQKCGNTAIDLHHLNYNNMLNEKFEDLIPLCRNCHNLEHKIK